MFLLKYMTADMLDVKSLIHRLQELGEPQKDFIFSSLNEFKNSPLYKDMIKAQEYYACKHDILNKERWYIDRTGTKREDKNLANNKLIHPYFTKLVNQKVNYLLSKEFSIQVDEKDAQAVKFQEAVSKYFNSSFFRSFRSVARHAIINGIAWMQVYYDKNGKLCFKRIPSQEIIPFWHNAEHTQLDAILRFYTIIEYKQNGEKEEITKVEYYTLEGTWYYEVRDGKLVVDEYQVSKEEPYKGHFQSQEQNEKGEQVITEQVWDRIPFVAFKYNDEEIPLLNFVKTLIDDYDSRTSNISDLIQDIPNSIRVIRGYGGGDKGEFSQNLATYRNIFVDENGGVEQLTANADTACTEAHLTRVKDDIYEAASGVNVQKENLSASSGVGLRIRYADLDNDCMSMARNLEAGIEELCWFIKVDLVNELGGNELDEVEFDVVFNADTLINESDVINDCKNSVGIISDETIMANHPWVTNLEDEIDRMKKQKEEEMEIQDEMFGTDTPNGSQPDNKTEDKQQDNEE